MLGGFGGFAADVIVKVTARKDDRADSAVDQHKAQGHRQARRSVEAGINTKLVSRCDVVCRRKRA